MQEMVYCFSTIQEVQRISAVASTALPHGLTKDYTVNGYHFPKGTSMIYQLKMPKFQNLQYLICLLGTFKISIIVFQANLKKYMNDPTIFPNPDMRIPERFIQTTSDGLTLTFKVWSLDFLR